MSVKKNISGIKAYLYDFINIGVIAEMGFTQKLTVQTLNLFCGIVCGIVFFDLVVFWENRTIADVVVNTLVSMVCVGFILMNYLKKSRLNAILFHILVPLIIGGIIALFGGQHYRLEIYTIIIICLGLIAFKEQQIQFLIIFWNLSCFIVGSVLSQTMSVYAPKGSYGEKYLLAILAIILVLTLSRFLVNSNMRFSEKIDKEKKRADYFLLNILPETTANELKANGVAKAQFLDNVTILFVDFEDFDKYYDFLSPNELVDYLDSIFTEFDKIIELFNLEKIKTIGKVYMAAGGVPEPQKQHAHNIIKAAFAIKECVREFGINDKAKAYPALKVKIGVNSGSVVSGVVGLNKFQFDVWGDTVNTASRMLESSEQGKINISSSTFELIKDDFNCEYRGAIQVKGKNNLNMYYALESKS